MRYVYPKLSDKDLLLFRIGGPGLGNLLFIFARAIVYAKNNNCELIWPTWPSIKLSTWMKNEKDKRFYGNLFKCPHDGYVKGIEKFIILTTRKKYCIEEITDEKEFDVAYDVCCYSVFRMLFEEMISDRDYIKDSIYKIVHPKYKKALSEDFSNSINVHIRLGDFARGNVEQLKKETVNTSIPLEWYVDILSQIRNSLNDTIKINIFSDGSDEELKPVLEISNTRRVFYGSAIADIIALAQSPLIIASASSFSMWARFLGGANCIGYREQMKEKLSRENSFEYEISIGEEISSEVMSKIKRLYL